MNTYIKHGILGFVGLIAAILILKFLWPFYPVPTGSRGVVTQFGRIVSVEGEGLTVLPPWQKLDNLASVLNRPTSRAQREARAILSPFT